MTARLAIFDCDGTLVDSQAEICAAMELACAESSVVAPDRNDIRRMVGLSLPQTMRALLPDADEDVRARVEAAYRRLFRAARESGRSEEPLYPGIAALLERLQVAGWQLGVATGKARRGLDHVLAVHGLTNRFVTLQTADNHPSKPHPAMLEAALWEADVDADQAVMIGDTQYDIAMAAAAGVRAIGVAWGYHSPQDLLAAGAEAVATDTRHLEELLG